MNRVYNASIKAKCLQYCIHNHSRVSSYPFCLSSRYVSTSSTEDQVEELIDPSIMEHLVCPISKYPLEYDAKNGVLLCKEIQVIYPIRHGIPILVPTEGRLIKEE